MPISKIVTDLYSIRKNIEIKKHFCRYCSQCVSSQRDLMEHRDIYLEINGKQRIELQSGSIEFKNYFKQIAAPFEIYADTECNFEKIHIYNRDKYSSYNEEYQNHLPCSFAYKTSFSKPVAFYRGKTKIYKLIEAILEEYDYWKQIIKERFNENLIISVEDEKRFQSSNKCLICNKLFTKKDKKK